jgi:hypothetical protein
MVYLLEFLLVVAAIGGIAIFTRRNRARADERETITDRRVAAYMETIRRERSNPILVAMSDTELRDLLLSSARNLKIERERRDFVLIGVGLVALVAGIVVGLQDGTRGFAITMAVGVVAIYGLSQYLGRKMLEPLLDKGIDPQRLKVE